MEIQCPSCDHRFETLPGPAVAACPMCGTTIDLDAVPLAPVPTALPPPSPVPTDLAHAVVAGPAESEVARLKDLPYLEPPEPRVPENGGLYSGMTASEVRASQAEAAEMMHRHVSPSMTFTLEVTAMGAQRAGVALYLGAFVEAVMDGVAGAEVRVRRRGQGLQVVANRFIPGGRRIEDSLHLSESALGTHNAPWDLGRDQGEACARVLRAAAPEIEDS